jgi:hypothetical protein
MLDGLGFPLSDRACSRRKGTAVPTSRPGRPYDHDQADAIVLRRAADLLREDPGRGRRVGLSSDEDATAAAALLEVLAKQVAHLDPAVRRRAVESCRAVLGESTADPGRT